MMRERSFWTSYGLFLAWIVALVATLGSLYMSEILHFLPCKLCWFQRICMYPLALILGIASYRGDSGIVRYAFPLAGIGAFIALYHYLLQMIPGLEPLSPCTGGVPCNRDYLDWYGFITIPLLALIAFVLIGTCLGLYRKAQADVTEG